MRRGSGALANALPVLLGALLGLASNIATNGLAPDSRVSMFLKDWAFPLVALLLLLAIAAQVWQYHTDHARPKTLWDPKRSPYPGLEPFETDEASVFFGRSAEIKAVSQRIRAATTERLVVVVGPSGSGKSSLVQAGVIPQLTAGGGRWLTLPTVIPSSDPVAGLAESLEGALGGSSVAARSAELHARPDAVVGTAPGRPRTAPGSCPVGAAGHRPG